MGVYTDQTEGGLCLCGLMLFLAVIVTGTSAVQPPCDLSVCFEVLVGPLPGRAGGSLRAGTASC